MGPELGYNALGGVSGTLLGLYVLSFTGAMGLEMGFAVGILARSSESWVFSYIIIGVLSFTILIPNATLVYLACNARFSLQIPFSTSRFKSIQYPLRHQKSVRVNKRSVRRRENFLPSFHATKFLPPHGIQAQPTPQSTRSIIHTNSASPSASILRTTMPASTSSGVEIPPSFKFYGPTMPRPGQPGAMQFDGKNITEFLKDWNMECEDFGLTEPQRCARFPNYCIKDIKETVKLLSGYLSDNWATLQKEIKELYWTYDTPSNTMAALSKLINEASTMDLNIYVLKYTSISEALVKAHALSPLDRVARLIDGLSEDVRRRVIRYCTQKGWKLSTQDAGKLDPDYKEITTFILTEARTNQTMAVFDSERTLRE